MRGGLIAAIFAIIIVLTSATIYGVEGKTTRQNELDANLSSAMERTMEIMAIDKSYSIENNKQLIGDFIQAFLIRINSESNVKVEIIGADAEKGLLSVKATEEFPLFFMKGTVSAERTIIVDDYVNAEDEYFEVAFYGDIDDEGNLTNPVKLVNIYGGSPLENLNPAEPVKDGYSFKGWELAVGGSLDEGNYYLTGQVYTDLENIDVTQALRFVADWEEDPQNTYTVTFYANNQLYDVKKVNVDSNYKVGEHKEKPTREGYEFKGWTCVEDELLSDAEVSEKVIKKHTKFTAVFEKKSS